MEVGVFESSKWQGVERNKSIRIRTGMEKEKRRELIGTQEEKRRQDPIWNGVT